MGLLSKVFKPIKKVFKKIGKGIKSAFKKFGKFMGKLGPLGTIAMGMILPGIGGMLGQAWSGLAGTLTAKGGLLGGVGNFMTKAASMGSAVSGTVSNITGAVTDVLKETFRAVGNKVGLGNLGPKGMQNFFAGSDGSLMGEKGLFTNVQKSFGKRWDDMSARWSNLGENLGKSTLDYQIDLTTGDYKPYKDYNQHATGLSEHMAPKTLKGVTDVKGKLMKEGAVFTDGLELDTPEGKWMSDKYKEFEQSVLNQSPTDMANNFKPKESFADYLQEQSGSFTTEQKGFFESTKTRLTELDLDDPKWDSLNKSIAEAVNKPMPTAYDKFVSGVTDKEKLGANLQSSLMSAGMSMLTTPEYEAQRGMGQLGTFYTPPIQEAIPVNTIEGYLNSPVQPQSFGLNEAYGWQTDMGQGIYGNKIRGLAPAPTAWTPQNSLMNYINNDQTIQLGQ